MAEELRTVMPLIGSSFEPGQAKNTVKNIKDRELADIAQAELFYFSGQRRHARRQWKPIWRAEMILFDFLRVCCILFRI